MLVIDAQPSFWRMMHGDRECVEKRIEQLLLLADLHQFPLIATFEHSTETNGWLPDRLDKVFPKHGQRIVKKYFDCCREPEVQESLAKLRKARPQVVVAGAETDVCVLQSCLGLLAMGFEVFLLEDCIFTNEPNIEPAIQRLRSASVVPCTYKTFFYEVAKQVGRQPRDKVFIARRERIGRALTSPYSLPRWQR